MKLIEKRHAYLQKRALDQAFDNFFKKFDTYVCTYFKDEEYDEMFDDKRLHIVIDANLTRTEFKKEKEKVEFNLPSLEEIINEAKKIYRKFDDSNLEKILYHFRHFGNRERFNKNVIINANGSNLSFHESIFRDIKIDNANNVDLFVCEALNDINIKASEIVLTSSELVAGRNIILNAKKIIKRGTSSRIMSSQKIVIDTDCIYAKDIDMIRILNRKTHYSKKCRYQQERSSCQ